MQVQVISNTIQKFDGVSYYLCGQYFQRKGKRLHRTVWEYHNGPIPEGCDIHHVDGDRSNNDISNLQLLKESEHHSKHMNEPERKEKSREDIKIAAEYSKAWHKTDKGFKFHSEHAKEYWEKAPMKMYTCTYCGKEFQTRHVYGKEQNTFCCAKHKSYWSRFKSSGIKPKERTA